MNNGKASSNLFHAVSAILVLMIMIPSLALVPHPFWNNHRVVSKFTRRPQRGTSSSLCMYFDDCERRGLEDEWEPSQTSWSIQRQQQPNKAITSTAPWIMSRSEEKKLAIEQLLGYRFESAAKLSDEQVEDETLHWAVDTNVLGVEDDDDEDHQQQQQQRMVCKYNSISDLIVASSCTTVMDSLALLWNVVARQILLQRQHEQPKSSDVYLIVFPHVSALWEYNVMVTILQAIAISKSLFPPELDVQLDLFHPDYKHSPRFWSPETHAPFPTVGIQIIRKTKTEEYDDSMDAVVSKLKALFDSMDAVGAIPITNKPHDDDDDDDDDTTTPEQVLDVCQQWILAQQQSSILLETSSTATSTASMKWMVQSDKEPYQLYTTLWNAISQLKSRGSSAMVVAPHMDAHTTHRVAVTVNAALQRLNAPVRINHVFHPNTTNNKNSNSKRRQSPYAMIHLVHT